MTSVLVCGLARCGTSLMMRMLHAGGMHVFADNVSSYESDSLNPANIKNLAGILPELEGKAAKILDPHRFEWPERVNAKVIWLDRDTREQAKSQVKLLRSFGGFSIPGQAWRAMERGLKQDRPRCMELFADRGVPVLVLRFEDVLASPDRCAASITEFLDLRLDVEAMAAVVVRRPPQCAPDMAMEEMLVATEAEREHLKGVTRELPCP